jgi:hypothetical protein
MRSKAKHPFGAHFLQNPRCLAQSSLSLKTRIYRSINHVVDDDNVLIRDASDQMHAGDLARLFPLLDDHSEG